MRFSEIVGNEYIVARLKESVTGQNPFHAYIFEGQSGVGKRLAASAFAQALLCSRPMDGEPCGSCSNCKKMESGNHGDYHYIVSDGKSVKDHQIEELQNQAGKKPFDAERSIFVIDQASTITERAQNRLLKTLEEPSGQSVIMLLVENMDAIVPTIASRCAIMRFRPVARNLILEHLIRQYSASEADAAMAAAFAYGSVGRGKRLLSDEDFQARRQRSIKCAESLVGTNPLAFFAEEIKEDTSTKEEALELLDLMEYWFRDALLLQRGAPAEMLLNQDSENRLRRTIQACPKGEKSLCGIIEKIERTKADVIMNVRTSYAFKYMFLTQNE